ncbi:hypothetical protein BGM25_25005 [Bacillus sp. FJAT-29953]|nr:hypothetical protein [Bacillus sp. FJAT-29953]
MRIYKTICHKVEDLFVKVLSKNQDPSIVKEKVFSYRNKQAGDKKLKI